MPRNNPATQYFFVGGAPKSGTTWIQRAVDQHPDVVCSGEGHIHEKIIAPMWRMFNDYSIKLEEVGRLVYESKPIIEQYSKKEIVEEIRHFAERVLRRGVEKEVSVIGDKTPKYYDVLNDLRIIFPGSKFLIALRDPRDVAASRIAQAHRSDANGVITDLPSAYAALVHNTITDWSICLEKCRKFKANNPDIIMIVRYEDMLLSAHPTLDRIFKFLGVDASNDQISDIVELTSFRSMSGRNPGDEDKSSFLRKGVSGDWVNMLSPELAERIVVSCGREMHLLGYDV